jgi:hypothetical protein
VSRAASLVKSSSKEPSMKNYKVLSPVKVDGVIVRQGVVPLTDEQAAQCGANVEEAASETDEEREARLAAEAAAKIKKAVPVKAPAKKAAKKAAGDKKK